VTSRVLRPSKTSTVQSLHAPAGLGDIDVVLLGNLQNRLAFFSHDVSAVDLEIDHEKTCLPVEFDAVIYVSPIRIELG